MSPAPSRNYPSGLQKSVASRSSRFATQTPRADARLLLLLAKGRGAPQGADDGCAHDDSLQTRSLSRERLFTQRDRMCSQAVPFRRPPGSRPELGGFRPDRLSSRHGKILPTRLLNRVIRLELSATDSAVSRPRSLRPLRRPTRARRHQRSAAAERDPQNRGFGVPFLQRSAAKTGPESAPASLGSSSSSGRRHPRPRSPQAQSTPCSPRRGRAPTAVPAARVAWRLSASLLNTLPLRQDHRLHRRWRARPRSQPPWRPRSAGIGEGAGGTFQGSHLEFRSRKPTYQPSARRSRNSTQTLHTRLKDYTSVEKVFTRG